MMRVLGAHDLFYPEGKGIVPRGRMTRGQLMGSILSFPILCLANYGVYCHVMSRVKPEWTISDLENHVLVNGDDMLYCAPVGTFTEHRRIAGLVGLDMSVGKAYEHHEYLNINSVACHSDLTRVESKTRRIDFLNVGLLFGQHKVQNRETAENHHVTSGVAACANEVLKGCFRNPRDMLKQYISLHKDELKEQSVRMRVYGRSWKPKMVTFQRDLFLPCSLGGMGINKPKGFLSNNLKYPRLLAVHTIDRAILDRCTPHPCLEPLTGYVPEVHQDVQAVPWSAREAMPVESVIDARRVQFMPAEWRDGLFEHFKTAFCVSVSSREHKI